MTTVSKPHACSFSATLVLGCQSPTGTGRVFPGRSCLLWWTWGLCPLTATTDAGLQWSLRGPATVVCCQSPSKGVRNETWKHLICGKSVIKLIYQYGDHFLTGSQVVPGLLSSSPSSKGYVEYPACDPNHPRKGVWVLDGSPQITIMEFIFCVLFLSLTKSFHILAV